MCRERRYRLGRHRAMRRQRASALSAWEASHEIPADHVSIRVYRDEVRGNGASSRLRRGWRAGVGTI